MELADLSKKSYTLDHSFDLCAKTKFGENKSNQNVTPRKMSKNEEKGHNENTTHTQILQPGSDIQPNVNAEDVECLCQRLYGMTIIDIKELISYDDCNFLVKEDRNVKNPLITKSWPHGYVLKILNAHDSKKTEFVDAQNELMLYLVKENIQCPKPIANVNGKYFSVEHINGGDHIVRLLEFIPGKMFHEVKKTNYLLYQSGVYIAKIDRALQNFSHEAYNTHKTLWMLQSVPRLKDFIYVLKDFSRKTIVEEIIEAFETEVLPNLDNFEKQIIHGDYNEQNIIVDLPKGRTEHKVTGIIDFGDTSLSPLIFEIGIAMTYMMIEAKNLASGGIFLAGYTSVKTIATKEKKYLKYCVAARLAQSLVMGAYTNSMHPSNTYVLVTQEVGWELIEELWRVAFKNIDELWKTTADEYLKQSIK